MERRFGIDQVCSVGTYTTMKLKSGIKDFARLEGLDVKMVEYMTAIIEEGLDDEKYTGSDNTQIFKSASQVPRLKSFVQDHSDIINDTLKILNAPRAQSVHPCATLIVPDAKDVYSWIPVKNMATKSGEIVLVSEWEGTELEAAGFLKEDILGIKQLDRFATILDLVKKNHGINVDIYNLPLEDEKVFRYFRKGWNQDVFHFGAKGLAQFCKQAQPENVEDLITVMSLYRPGPIESNLHMEFILRKSGDKEVEYLWGTEEITKETYGVLVYQEQIMKTCVQVGGFSLVEADDIRKALGKKKRSIIDGYKDQFISGATTQGCPEEEAKHIWEQMEKFASYSFNKSHAAAYTLTGYASQYLKVHYPIEYWTAAFEYVATDAKKDLKIPHYMSEIYKTGAIKLSPPDINNSEFDTHSLLEENTIFWGLTSVKMVGGIAAEQIVADRREKGKYFSFEEFLARHTFKGSKVNKQHIENLIICGAFDKVENIQNSAQRYRLIKYYRETNKVKIDVEKDLFTKAGGSNIYADWWWQYQQKLLCGLAYFDYADLTDRNIKDASYLGQDDFQSKHLLNRYYCTGGFVSEVRERTSKKKGTYCSLVIESNYEFLTVNIFPEKYKEIVDSGVDLLNCQGKLIILSGMFKFDDRAKENTMKIWDSSEVMVLD